MITNITRNTAEFIVRISATRKREYGLLVAWILAMIALPIMKWTFGTDIIPAAVTFALMIQFTAVLYILVNHWGLRLAMITLGIVAVITWGIEGFGSATGFPFGGYDYTTLLQPQIGHVPLLIPFAWFMMLPSSWAIAHILTKSRKHTVYYPALYIAVSALAMTAWDLFLDPQMVAWGFWEWDVSGAYFGIPLVNYAGWLLTGVIVTAVIRPYKKTLPIAPLIVIYAVVWFLQSVGQAVFWGQPGPSIIGCIVMGSLLFSAIKQLKQG